MTTTIPGVGVFAGLPEDLYHEGIVDGKESLSHSGMKLLTTKTPAKFRWETDHRDERKPKREFDIGHAAHQEVLGVGPELKEIRADDWRSPRIRDAADELRAVGILPLLTKDYQAVKGMGNALRAHPTASTLLAKGGGVPEVSAFAVDPESQVMLRARFDWLRSDAIVDYKSGVTANPIDFGKRAFDFGYYIQHATYLYVAQLAGVDVDQFHFVLQETSPPYLVSTVHLEAEDVEVGLAEMRRAISIYANCIASGEWPGYPTESVAVALPQWARSRHQSTQVTVPDGDPAEPADHSGIFQLLDSLAN